MPRMKRAPGLLFHRAFSPTLAVVALLFAFVGWIEVAIALAVMSIALQVTGEILRSRRQRHSVDPG